MFTQAKLNLQNLSLSTQLHEKRQLLAYLNVMSVNFIL
jgi:hypothetical protein